MIQSRYEENGAAHPYGEVVLGTIGGVNRKKERAVGDAVNFTSRIGTANRELGSRLLVSADVYEQVREQIRVGQRFHTMVPGKSVKYTLYEVIALARFPDASSRPPRFV